MYLTPPKTERDYWLMFSGGRLTSQPPDITMTITRPPNDRGQGRKPLAAGVETVTMSIRLTPEQRAKVERLGGAQWLRQRINKATDPPLLLPPIDAGGPIKRALAEAIAAKLDREIMNMINDRS